MVILDPIQAFLGDSDIQRANNIRPIMTRLSRIAEEKNCAIILVGHLTKNENGKDLYRGLGSVDFVAAARSVLMVSKVEEGEENERMLSHIKSNLAKRGTTLIFTLDECGIENWRPANVLELVGEQKTTKGKFAEKVIDGLISQTEMRADEISNILSGMGFSVSTIKRAKASLGVSSKKVGTEWYWYYE